MLSSLVTRMLGGAIALLVFAALLGNNVLLYMALVPLFVAVCGLVLENPGDVRLVLGKRPSSAWVNEDIRLSTKLSVASGVGTVTVADELPEHFQLVEGSNFRVFWKGLKPLDVEMPYSVRCAKRGVYRIGPVRYECRHFFGFKQTLLGSEEEQAELTVRVMPQNIKRMRDPRVLSRIPMPLGAVAKLGMMTTDFREIREYARGDPYRYINWKATARLASAGRALPLVNEFEREGKKVVWVFLDGSSSMTIGTNLENAFEYALQATSGLTEFYLARSCHVALYVYNDHGTLILPDAGRRQEFKLNNEILRLEASDTREPLPKAIERCRAHLVGMNPFFIVITTVKKDNVQELLTGVKELRKYAIGRRGRPQILVLHVVGYGIAARSPFENAGALLLEMKNQYAVRALRRSGAFVIPWNPMLQSLPGLMVAGMVKK